MGVRYWFADSWGVHHDFLAEEEDGMLYWADRDTGARLSDTYYIQLSTYRRDNPDMHEIFPAWASPSQVSEEKPLSDVNIIREALDGQRGEDQKRIAEVGVQIVATLLKKNKDYQGSAYKSPCLLQKLSPREGIQVRMSDKIQRLQNLLKGNAAEVKESVEDTVCDLSGYGILWLTAPEEAR